MNKKPIRELNAEELKPLRQIPDASDLGVDVPPSSEMEHAPGQVDARWKAADNDDVEFEHVDDDQQSSTRELLVELIRVVSSDFAGMLANLGVHSLDELTDEELREVVTALIQRLNNQRKLEGQQ